MIRGDVLIDDGIHNLEGGDYKKILFTAAHNRNYDAEANGMIRVRKETREGTSDSPGQYILPIAIGTGKVRTTLYYTEHEAQEGDLRIREVLDLSDPSYGMLVRCEGNTFVNEIRVSQSAVL
jgi:hypothetical protein